MRSLSEIETTSKRATRAAGFSWGIAEEVGKGIRLMELFGFAGILPFLSRSSEIIGKKIHIKFDQYEFLLNFNVNISSNLLNKDYPKITNKVEINILENVDNFTNQDWNNLYKISEKTFVEETDSSKQVAAGAGLTDND